jgi:hypothetical protein
LSKRSSNPRRAKNKTTKKKSASPSRAKRSTSKAAARGGRREKGARRSARTRAARATVTTRGRRVKAQPKNRRATSKGRRRETSKKFFVRIFGSGQYTISKNTLNKLNKLDNNIVKLLSKEEEDSKSESQFREVVSKMVSIVKREGKPIPPEDIVPSHAIIPDQQITLDEARQIFSGEGAVPEHLVF